MLEARNVSFSYGKKKPILSGLDLEVSPGERLALQAPSGFGKTTLCKMLAGYLQPEKGEILCEGRALPAKCVSPVQMIWQHPEKAVDPRMRMKKTLEEGASVPVELRARIGIKDEWLTRFPHELSGGELQRICIARALAVNPPYLIADEISTMLDAVTQAQIWDFLIDELDRRRMGLVFVSHSPALTERLATRAINLIE